MMKTAFKAISTATSITLMLLCRVINAQQPSIQNIQSRHAAPGVSKLVCSMILSFDDDRLNNSEGHPKPTVTLLNISPYTLQFYSDGWSFVHFKVEYSASDSYPASHSSWKLLKSIILAPPVPPLTSPVPTSTSNVLETLLVGRERVFKPGYDSLDGLPMSVQGFYRITAISKIPNVYELSGSVSSPILVRKFDLDVSSNSVIVHRTASGFVAVDAATGKPVTSP